MPSFTSLVPVRVFSVNHDRSPSHGEPHMCITRQLFPFASQRVRGECKSPEIQSHKKQYDNIGHACLRFIPRVIKCGIMKKHIIFWGRVVSESDELQKVNSSKVFCLPGGVFKQYMSFRPRDNPNVREKDAARRILRCCERLAVQHRSERHQRTASMDDINSFSVVRFDGHSGVWVHCVF